MRYLVTGGAGYIGAIVATMLCEDGHEVVILDDLSTGDATRVPCGARLVSGRVHEVAEHLTSDVDAVFHFAGLIAAGESMSDPAKYWDANVSGTLALLDAMRAKGVSKLVFSSTAAVYGDPAQLPITEDAVAAPTSAYGATKLAADHAISSYCAAYGVAAVSLRYFNVAGAYRDRDGGWHGERHEPETHLIPLALATAAGEREALDLFGEDYDTRDGSCVRDYIHVADLARAHLLALTHLDGGKHRFYNLGNGTGFSNKEVIAAVAEVTGLPVEVRPGPRRPGDPAELVASSAAASRELGWKPRKPRLSQIVADAWEFYRRV